MNIKTISIVFFITLFSSINTQAQDISYDKKIGKEAHEEIISTVGMYDHPYQKYIEQIGQRLVSSLTEKQFNYQFHILDILEPNAMALPGGYIYFSRGILPLANSEAELAGKISQTI